MGIYLQTGVIFFGLDTYCRDKTNHKISPWGEVPHLAGGSRGHDPLPFGVPVVPGFQKSGRSFDALAL